METYVLNGTNAVVPMNGTNAVVPMNGTNAVVPMNGYGYYDFDVMNGTNEVVPMQGTNDVYYVHPHALLSYDDVPMQGIPADYTDADIFAYQNAYLFGDPDAMQGLFSKFKAKRKAAKAGNKAAKSDRQARRAERRAFRKSKRDTGTRFIDRFGGAIANVGEALKLKAQTADALEDEGIDYDDELLTQKSMMAADNGAEADDDGGDDGGGMLDSLKNWWNGQETVTKVIVGAGGLYLGYKGLQLAGIIDSKKSKRK